MLFSPLRPQLALLRLQPRFDARKHPAPGVGIRFRRLVVLQQVAEAFEVALGVVRVR
jgi:hypothetical protein